MTSMTGSCRPSCSRHVKWPCPHSQSKSKQTSSWRPRKMRDRWSLKMNRTPTQEHLMTRTKVLHTWRSMKQLKLTTKVTLRCVTSVACPAPLSTLKVSAPLQKLQGRSSQEAECRCWPRTVDHLRIMASSTKLNLYLQVPISLFSTVVKLVTIWACLRIPK